MYVSPQRIHTRGVSFIEVLVTAAIIGLVFGGLLTSFQFAVALIANSKAQSGAVSLTNERIEYLRSLQYDDIGTEGGIPYGTIPQTRTVVLNGISYEERVLVEYVDAPDDGLGALDDNGILADYKSLKVVYTWNIKGVAKSISLVSNIVPPGIETTAGGGTLTVNVFDSTAQPVVGATVHLYNNNGTTTIDTTRFTNSSGVAMFSGAPARAGYQITVTNTGYSTDQTYSASTTNPNPLTPHVAVLESQVSTMNFQIDALSELEVVTQSIPTFANAQDTFADVSKIATSTNVVVSGGAAMLAGGAGTYAPSGSFFTTDIIPGSFEVWDTLLASTSVPTNTTLLVRIYDATGSSTLALVPDAVIPSNSTGVSPSAVNLTALSATPYEELALEFLLTTTDSNVTPAIFDWDVQYLATDTPIPNIPFTLTSGKTIGTTASATPVHKYQSSETTDGTGNVLMSDLEWDVYTVTLGTGAYDIAEACANIPYALSPGVSETLTLTLAPAAARSLRIRVEDVGGASIIGADVTLSRSGFSDTGETSSCGQTFFNSGLVSAIDYQVFVEAAGYIDETVTDVTIDDADTLVVTMSST